jgi:hypothetical protein
MAGWYMVYTTLLCRQCSDHDSRLTAAAASAAEGARTRGSETIIKSKIINRTEYTDDAFLYFGCWL